MDSSNKRNLGDVSISNSDDPFNITSAFNVAITPKYTTIIGERKYFTDDEIKSIFNYIYSQMKVLNRQIHARYALVFMTQLFTGARVGEVLQLKPVDIDIQQNTITLITEKKQQYPLPTRKMQLNPRLKDVWVSYALEFSIPIRSTEKIFNLTIQGINKYTHRITEATGIYVKSHKFRHTFAHKCDEAGFTVPQIGALLGHSSKNLSVTGEYLKYIGTEIDLTKLRWEF